MSKSQKIDSSHYCVQNILKAQQENEQQQQEYQPELEEWKQEDH